MTRKFRPGEDHPKATLNPDKVRAIRAVPDAPGINKKLAAEYGVTAAAIHGVRKRLTWRLVE